MQNWQSVVTSQPFGMVFDIDGTLSPIAPTPDEARLFPGVVSLLEQARHLAHVAIMTGRAIDNGAAMVNVEDLTYIGSHGLEWSEGLPANHTVQISAEAMEYIEPCQQLLTLAEQQLADLPGILVERKNIGGAIHYRRSPDPEQARKTILARLEQPARTDHLRLSEGKRVVEVKTPLAVNKGRALRTFVEHFALRGILFAGDDRTDLDAILEIERLRQEGLAAVAIVVQHADTPPELLEHADVIVQEVDGMVHLLAEIVQKLTDQHQQ
ncbi:MAG TPA: trehalose-phosphatase [Ktedonobacteraceae bacterium]|jgi:trehalose 6-phosphate phosphatase|nr:trehalose-phosphatase [Ktedonobacteraceae bacterium]